jgi:dTDP-glucose 4,6-dehydratase
LNKILITGGLGFISSHIIRLFVKNYPAYNVRNSDLIGLKGDYHPFVKKSLAKHPFDK